jgi:Protein of unknown function (DUF1488)
MPVLYCTTSTSLPHWDGNCVLFEITEHGVQVPCAVSGAALEALGEERWTEPADPLERFARARLRIEALARDKLHARRPGVSGRLSLWAGDVDDLPPGGESASGRLQAAWLQSS